MPTNPSTVEIPEEILPTAREQFEAAPLHTREAMKRVFRVLDGLSKDQQKRVLKAVALLEGLDLT